MKIEGEGEREKERERERERAESGEAATSNTIFHARQATPAFDL